MEKRRQELLADSTGYWRQRMAEQLAAEALLQGEDGTSTGEVCTQLLATPCGLMPSCPSSCSTCAFALCVVPPAALA